MKDAFIVSASEKDQGHTGEQKVWESLKKSASQYFTEGDFIAYWKYPIFTRFGQGTDFREPDILLLHKTFGINIIEVKDFSIDKIKSIQGYNWDIDIPQYINPSQPIKQAEKQLRSLVNHITEKFDDLEGVIPTRTFIALPRITKGAWLNSAWNNSPNVPLDSLIFQDDMSPSALHQTLLKSGNYKNRGGPLQEDQWECLLAAIGGGNILRKTPQTTIPIINTEQATAPSPIIFASRKDVLQYLDAALYKFDAHQEKLAKQIPPGPQRIRGIAGSGKTILLCQRAALLHLQNPNAKIAFVFFSQSLRSTIKSKIEQYIKVFSRGEASLDEQKLMILHAWGNKGVEGFYTYVCRSNELKYHTVGSVNADWSLSPTQSLNKAVQLTLVEAQKNNKTLKDIFDFVLIDEGQDLLSSQFLFDEKHPYYWFAYQSIKPTENNLRRLFWAYDEAQSLDNMIIPDFKTVLGQEAASEVARGASYKNGIPKSEVMTKCYRTPGPILIAAHVLGMGLKRTGGIIYTISRQDQWEKIGYQIDGQFYPGRSITLSRPPDNSPNPIPNYSNAPCIAPLQISTTKNHEYSQIAQIIKTEIDSGFPPNRILLLVPYSTRDSWKRLILPLVDILRLHQIPFYIAGSPTIGAHNFDDRNERPEQFTMPNAITISHIPRAKGNEADLVFFSSLEKIADNESSMQERNNLFIGMTRARGWLYITGTHPQAEDPNALPPFYKEVDGVIRTALTPKPTFTFTYTKPTHDLQDTMDS